ncbi:1963_t:CDS:1 [Ambispora gerdemannii]|uniref:1963_t:CDS:1 n=1 Tax=Ambispora gerdemannii TaxID=144530 RepID=A0A9N9F2F8_9GLOM|nr:1963_t:CDS:1 [Ambispora gerdemannii]
MGKQRIQWVDNNLKGRLPSRIQMTLPLLISDSDLLPRRSTAKRAQNKFLIYRKALLNNLMKHKYTDFNQCKAGQLASKQWRNESPEIIAECTRLAIRAKELFEQNKNNSVPDVLVVNQNTDNTDNYVPDYMHNEFDIHDYFYFDSFA